jgi:fructose-1,6-bisphosphatase
MANIKEIQRDERFEVRLSKEEKDLFFKLAEAMNMKPGRLARNLIMEQVNANIENAILLPFIKAYKNYLKITKQEDKLREIEEDE